MKAKSTLNLEASCDPVAVIKTMKVGDHKLVGTLFAFADDFMSRANPAGGPAIQGLSGRFEIVSAIGGDDVSSNNLFLPEPIFAEMRMLLMSQLYRNADKPEKKSRGAISFAASILVMKKDDAGNYAFGLDMVDKPAVYDPLHAMKAKHVAKPEAHALELKGDADDGQGGPARDAKKAKAK